MNRKILATLFGLAAVAAVASTIPQFNFLFNAATRWLFMFALLVPVFMSGSIFSCLLTPFGFLAVVYTLWCMLTSFWSAEPMLTLAKSVAMGMTALALASGGMAWARTSGPKHLFTPFVGFTAAALGASLIGLPSEKAFDIPTEGITLFQGAVTGSNLLGIMQAMAMPFLLWRLYIDRANPLLALFWAALILAAFVFCLLSGSRGALIATLLPFLGFALAFGFLRFTAMLMAGAVALLALLVVVPAANDVARRIVYKTSDTGASLFSTRESVWIESLEMAKSGGATGAGFGVSIGSESFEGGFTAVGYGREKGNSQLAILEELGFVGLTLYIALLGGLIVPLVTMIMNTRDTRRRMAGGIVLGSLLGITGQSLFEAWFVAPGAPESAYFWALAGLSLGLTAAASPRKIPGARFRLDRAGLGHALAGADGTRSKT